MDFYLWARYLVNYGISSICTTEDILAHYREHGASKSARLNAQFKDEINGIFAELLKSLEAPAFLTEHFTKLTTGPVPDVSWEAGSNFERKRLFAILSFQVARKFYYERAYVAARQWLQRSLAFQPSLRALRFYMKLLFKKSA
jgi:hypothetical protein